MPVAFRQQARTNLVEIIGYLSVVLFCEDGEKSICFGLMP